MGKFKDFLNSRKLNESVDVNEEDFNQDNKLKNEVYGIIDNDAELQKTIDDVNDELDSEFSVDESMMFENNYSPFETDGTFYNGGEDEIVDILK